MARSDQHPELPVDSDVHSEVDESPQHLRPASVALVAVGGCAGTSARYALLGLLPAGADGWSAATLTANLAGALVLGALLEGLARSGLDVRRRRQWRLLAGVGFCGAFTTYSSLAVDVTRLVRGSHPATALAYAGTTVIVGFLVTMLGVWLASRLHRSSESSR